MILQELEKHFMQFAGECTCGLPESPMYKERYEEAKATLEKIKSLLPDENKALCRELDELYTYAEAVATDDYFKAGFIAGVRLGQ